MRQIIRRIVVDPNFYFTRTVYKDHILTNLEGAIHFVKNGKTLKCGLHEVEGVIVGNIINFLESHFNFFKINRARVDR